MQLQVNQIMNVFKPYNNIDLYFTIQNNKLVLINQQKDILAELQVDYNLYPGFSDSKFSNGNQIAIQNHLYHNVMCAGKIYVQLFDKIYVLKDAALKYVATIPDLDYDIEQSFYATMISREEFLYVINHKGSLYVLLNDNFQHVKQISGFPYQFCDNSCIRTNNNFYLLNDNMSTENLSKIGDNIDVDKCFPSKTNKYSFNTGAIVLQNYENHCIAVDMIMKQYKIVEFEPLKHMQSVELRPCGLVNTQLLEAVFGKQYIQQVDAEHEKFMENQLKYQVFSQEVNKVLEKCMDQLPEEYRIQVQLQIASTRRCHVHQPEILHNNQLMNVLKLNKFFDVYASISNDHIYLFNQKKEVLRKIPVDFHLYPGSTYKNYCYGKECVFYPQLHNVVYCGSHIYLQYYEKVLELTEDLTLKFIATIPNLTINSAEAFYGRLFSMNGKLYTHNYNGSESYSGMLHELQNGVFVEVKEMGGSFFQFGDKVFVWNYKEQTLSKLSENLELTRIEVNSKQMEQVQLISWANGVIIMYAKGGAQFVMLNMHTEQIFANQLANPHEYNNKLILKNDKVYNSNDFDRSQILYCTELGQNGFQIQSQIVNDIFGQQSAENIIKAQHNSQFKDILKFASVCFDAQFNNYKHLQLLKERTQMQQQDIQTKINNLIQINGKLTKLFDQLMLCQQQQ
ncbi:Conserved_hypothetical protein [Hexamita inflata]|uniref:Uncharacterized protein n=1 Tax=Hexamita inflata TaxID=28002 RepID=A0AA86QUN5_9EUKA|nr:Conserved hypothetical protein [Hexamita inflata]